MHTDRYPSGLRWACDEVGEGAARPAPRQGRTRAHPQRFTTAVPRSRHQRHRHGPALRGGRSVQAHAVPALRRQGRADRRTPTPIRSRHPARSVRPHRPHTSRTTPRRLRHPLRPCARSSRRPSKSPTRATRHASTPATTRRPLPRGSPIPPARPAPPTPNSSANNWRCSWMAPRPAAESSTPTPSPPPPPSPPSSSTTPSPRQSERGPTSFTNGCRDTADTTTKRGAWRRYASRRRASHVGASNPAPATNENRRSEPVREHRLSALWGACIASGAVTGVRGCIRVGMGTK